MAYGKSKDLAKRTQPDKVLRDKAFKIAFKIDPKYDGYQRVFGQTYKSLNKYYTSVSSILSSTFI